MAKPNNYGKSKSEEQPEAQRLRTEHDQISKDSEHRYKTNKQALDDYNMIWHLKTLQSALSVLLFQMYEPLLWYKKWVIEIQRYTQISKLEDKEIRKIAYARIAYVSCEGPPVNFININI